MRVIVGITSFTEKRQLYLPFAFGVKRFFGVPFGVGNKFKYNDSLLSYYFFKFGLQESCLQAPKAHCFVAVSDCFPIFPIG